VKATPKDLEALGDLDICPACGKKIKRAAPVELVEAEGTILRYHPPCAPKKKDREAGHSRGPGDGPMPI
jgi:hypothetical protein